MNFVNCSQAIIMKMAFSPSDAQDISCTTRVQRVGHGLTTLIGLTSAFIFWID